MNGFDVIIQPDGEDPDAAEMLVDGTVGGFPYRFLLDTGAATSSITFDEYTATFACVERKGTSGVFAASELELIQVPLLELGPISRHDLLLNRAHVNLPVRANCIGMDLLKDFCCHFLFDEQRVLIQDEPPFDLPVHELLLGKKFHPHVRLQFGETQATAVWDTGAGITLADLNFINTYPALFQEVGHSQGTDATGTSMQTPLFIMTSPLIGNAVFSPHKVVGVDLSHMNARTDIPTDLILGYTTLRQANWWFDFPGKRWAISKRVNDH